MTSRAPVNCCAIWPKSPRKPHPAPGFARGYLIGGAEKDAREARRIWQQLVRQS